VLNQEDPWTDRTHRIGEVLPIHDARTSALSVRPGLKQMVLEQMQSSEAILQVAVPQL